MSVSKEKEFYYTICPVGNASYIAANNGFLQKGFEKHGVHPIKLQTLPRDRWDAHFTYENNSLFREGGNTPPLWAKSNDADVLLIGLNSLKQRQVILTRADSEIIGPEDLRNARIGIPIHSKALIDFHRASAEQAFDITLTTFGISEKEVTLVPLIDDTPWGWSGSKGARTFIPGASGIIEVDALDNGLVDAIFVKLSLIQQLLDTGRYKVVYDLSTNSVRVPPINNEFPNTLTVSTHLANQSPELVVEYIKQTLLAAKWAASHKDEAEALLAEQTFGTIREYQHSFAEDFYLHLTPDLSEYNLKALEDRARFLYDHGYLKKAVDVYAWVDPYFLNTAVSELEKEQA